jgi:hypothetical protein
MLGLAAAGLLRVRLRPPRDREEREAWYAKGHRPYTLEFNALGAQVRIGLSSGLWMFRAAAGLVGSFQDYNEQKTKQATRLAKEAARRGLTPTQFESHVVDALSVASNGLFQALTGGRTLGGGLANVINPMTGAVEGERIMQALSGYVPFAPLIRSVERAANLYTDRTRMASDSRVMSALSWFLPASVTGKPWRKPALNFFGDPLTPGGLQQISDSLTGNVFGTYEGKPAERAYELVFKAGYLPAPMLPGQGVIHLASGDFGPLPEAKYYEYRESYGKALKAALNEAPAGMLSASPEAIAAYLKAKEYMAEGRTLYRMGYERPNDIR